MSAVPCLYVGHIVHVRRRPILRVFRHRMTVWLVDLDHIPELPRWLRPLAAFRAEDHSGSPDRGIRANIDAWLASRDIDLRNGRILMLAVPRVLGHCFNPLTVYWCHDADGSLVCVVAEVSNTYGERHCYVVPPFHGQPADLDKEFYVSPFFETDGRYRMHLPAPGKHLSLTVSLLGDDGALLTSVLRGRRRVDTPARMALATALMPQRISALIRLHGIRLWLRGLPVVPRIPHRANTAERSAS
ncbi:DUF1365 domain-containing protein [Streptomycetaceae bacterium NBC_01309]